MKLIEEYFNIGVELGKIYFRDNLKGDSLLASKFNDEQADCYLRKTQKDFGATMLRQDLLKRGLIMGVKVAGSNLGEYHGHKTY